MRRLALLFAALFCLSLFSACSGPAVAGGHRHHCVSPFYDPYFDDDDWYDAQHTSLQAQEHARDLFPSARRDTEEIRSGEP